MKKNQTIIVRMDGKLYRQLTEYSKRNDNSIVSLTARKAIEKFLNEQPAERL